jgi:hypothetical protein
MFYVGNAVDGGHRAIKYSRISGVKKEIFAEGKFSNECHEGQSRS